MPTPCFPPSVKFKLYKGNIIKAGTTSPYSLYSESLASFTTGDLYDHHDADGFINLFGLPLKVRAMKMPFVYDLGQLISHLFFHFISRAVKDKFF